MNPMLSAAVGSILRWALALAAGFLVRAGIWTSEDAEVYIGGAALGLIALGWSFWQKYQSRLKLVSALTLPKGSTEDDARTLAKSAAAPSVTTPTDEVPKVTSPRD